MHVITYMYTQDLILEHIRVIKQLMLVSKLWMKIGFNFLSVCLYLHMYLHLNHLLDYKLLILTLDFDLFIDSLPPLEE